MEETGFERNLLRDTAAEFAKTHLTTGFTRQTCASETGMDKDTWAAMAELGWTGILVPEQYGGFGLGLADMAAVIQELGRTAYQGPLFSTAVSAALMLVQASNESIKANTLPGLAAGSLLITPAVDEGAGVCWRDFSTSAVATEGGFRLEGTKLFVPYANVADKLIVAAHCEDGTGLYLVDRDQPGIEIVRLDNISDAKLYSVNITGVEVSEDQLLTAATEGGELLNTVCLQSALLKSAEMLGGAQSAQALAVEHVQIRKQFGVPIGQFQALQHMCADMFTYTDTAEMLVNESVDAVDRGEMPLSEAACLCKIWVSDAYEFTVKKAHQMMGGTGYMEETDLHLYFRHAKSSELAFGGPDFYRDLLAKELGII